MTDLHAAADEFRARLYKLPFLKRMVGYLSVGLLFLSLKVMPAEMKEPLENVI